MIDHHLLQWSAAGGFVALLLMAAVTDILRRRIPNWVIVGLIVLYVLTLAIGVAPSGWISGLSAGGLSLLLTYGLYHFDIVGAGDAKLFTVAALFAGLSHLAAFSFMTALAGGAMALGVMILHPKRVMRGLTAAGRAEGAGRGIPYGVAIAVGAIAAGALNQYWPILP